MDKRSRREWIRAWIALGAREGVSFQELAKRSGISARSLSRWSRVFREESRRGVPHDDDQHAFLQLVERVQGGPTRIEMFIPGEPRLVVDAAAIVRLLISFLRSAETKR